MNTLAISLGSKLTPQLHESSPKKYHMMSWVFAVAIWVALAVSIVVAVISLIRGYEHGLFGNVQPQAQETLNVIPLQCPYCGGLF